MKARNREEDQAQAIAGEVSLDTLTQELVRALRDQVEYLKADVSFYKGKCERLELALARASERPAGEDYVRRTDAAARRPIEQTQTAPATPAERMASAKNWQQTQQVWNSLSPEEQAQLMGTEERRPTDAEQVQTVE